MVSHHFPDEPKNSPPCSIPRAHYGPENPRILGRQRQQRRRLFKQTQRGKPRLLHQLQQMDRHPRTHRCRAARQHMECPRRRPEKPTGRNATHSSPTSPKAASDRRPSPSPVGEGPARCSTATASSPATPHKPTPNASSKNTGSKAKKERHFSEVLTGLDLHRPPCHSLRANRAYYLIAALAYNLIIAVRLLDLATNNKPGDCAR
jgi:hypothetical protein